MQKITMNTAPSSPPTSSKKSRKPLIAIAVVVIIIVVVLGVYFAMGGFSGTNSSATPTPTKSSSATPAPSSTSSASATAAPTSTATTTGVSTASSLKYTVTDTTSSGVTTSTFYAKNMGTTNLMMRIEETTSGHTYVIIINGATKNFWMETDGQWVDMSSEFQSQWSTWEGTISANQATLANWSGVGSYSYTSPNGDTVQINNIQVNPSLSDSLFTHS
jgi:hypothetical protein